MSMLSWIIYIPLQVAALPPTFAGAAHVGYRQLVVSRRLGVSQTAIAVFNARWALDRFGLRADPGAARLGPFLPNNSTSGMQVALWPLWIKAQIAGKPAMYPRHVERGHESLVDLITARTIYFDEVLARQLPHMEQFVMLGAGMDTRPYGALDVSDVRVFEVDREATQTLKRDTLSAAGIDTSHVTFVTVDFARDDLFARLKEAGYDPDKRTLFLWEGVTLYLEEHAVRHTMQHIKAHAAKGSVLLADIYAQGFIRRSQLAPIKAVLSYTGETMRFGVDMHRDWEAELKRFVEDASWTVGEAFFMGSSRANGPFMAVVEMRT